ncbi:MAG: segregation/condensation protein A, partial [Pelagibaca sp.]|nr:segregation/condensation protein A [Pelagibaca sp.]
MSDEDFDSTVETLSVAERLAAEALIVDVDGF